MKRQAKARAILAILAASACSTVARASPEDLFGYGARTSAMGATGVSHAYGADAAFHNPALLSRVRANALTLGYQAALFRLDAEGAGLPGRISSTPMKGIAVGAELPLPFGGVLRDRIGLGFAFYTPSDVVVRGRALYPERPQFPILPSRAQSVTLRGGVGVDVGHGLRVGVGVAALAEIVGTVVAATDATGRVGTSVENQLVATYAPAFGATYERRPRSEMGPTYRVGVTFRGSLEARFGVVVDGSKLSSLNIPLLDISGVAQYDPAQAAVEVSRSEGRSVLALQLGYKRWGAFPGFLRPTVVCSEGGAGACGLVPPTIDWRDTFVVRVGAERGFALADGLTLRARGGAFYESSPLPNAVAGSEAFDPATRGTRAVPTRYFDADRVAFTTGLGVLLFDPLPPIDLDLFLQVHFLVPRTITTTDAASVTLGEGEASGAITAFGTSARVRF